MATEAGALEDRMWWWTIAWALAAGPDARFAAGVEAIQRGEPAEAAAAFEVSCAAGNQMACANLAAQLERGHGVSRDPSRAVRLHRSACDADLALSCDALGTLTTNGVGVPADDVAAVALYRRACELDLAVGCRHLAVMLDGGFGADRSWELAKASYGRACDLGDGEACWHLGRKLLGLRRPDAAVEGMARAQRACDLEIGEACATVAAASTDPAAARSLAERACELGHAPSCGADR